MTFVDRSGVGKTSLLALLPQLHDPQQGRICIDDVDIANVTLHSLRSQIGIVSQDVYLFGETLRENIIYGRLGASAADSLQAADKAQLTDMIAQMPDGVIVEIGSHSSLSRSAGHHATLANS